MEMYTNVDIHKWRCTEMEVYTNGIAISRLVSYFKVISQVVVVSLTQYQSVKDEVKSFTFSRSSKFSLFLGKRGITSFSPRCRTIPGGTIQ